MRLLPLEKGSNYHMERVLLFNIGVLATPLGYGPKGGAAQGAIQIQRDAWVLLEGERIFQVGTGTPPDIDAERIDAEGGLVTPGLVDAHTHLIFGGWRQNELGMKLMVSPISISLPKAAVSFLPSKAHGRPAKRS